MIATTNPFIEAYYGADLLGKLIYLSILFTSVFCWVVLLYKILMTYRARQNSNNFYNYFQDQKSNPLSIEWSGNRPNPFLDIYQVLKRQTMDLINKNRHFGGNGTLSASDMECIESHLLSTIAKEVKNLEQHIFVLATIVGLAPLLGLLGTVWGILVTFSDLQNHTASSQMMLSGLSLALTTTVLGLLTAIPALIGYNYIKNGIRGFETEMESFSTEILSTVEMQYRKVD